jgi:clan AA aspartic protease
MTSGEVTKSLEPIVELTLVGKEREYKEWAVIDTGFNGFISLPASLLETLRWEHVGYERYEIATGETVRQRIYIGGVRFMEQEQQVVAVASGAKDALIGTRLLDANNCILQMNFPKRSLWIEREEV